MASRSSLRGGPAGGVSSHPAHLIPLRELVTIAQAASILGVSPQTLRRWDKLGIFKSRRHPINGYRLYSRTKLAEWGKTLGLPNMRKKKKRGAKDASKSK
jgi:hypothetical protein